MENSRKTSLISLGNFEWNKTRKWQRTWRQKNAEVGCEDKQDASAEKETVAEATRTRMIGSLPNRAHEGNQICYNKLPDTGFLSKVLTKTQGRVDLGDNQPLTLQMGRMKPSSIKWLAWGLTVSGRGGTRAKSRSNPLLKRIWHSCEGWGREKDQDTKRSSHSGLSWLGPRIGSCWKKAMTGDSQGNR